jgi:hypothetical protein
LISPASFDTPLRSGPRHCGQSDGPLGTVFGAVMEFVVSDDDASTENQMRSRAAGSANNKVNKRLCFNQFSLSPTMNGLQKGARFEMRTIAVKQ